MAGRSVACHFFAQSGQQGVAFVLTVKDLTAHLIKWAARGITTPVKLHPLTERLPSGFRPDSAVVYK